MKALFAGVVAASRFVPSPSRVARIRSQISDIFHVPDDFPVANFYHVGLALSFLCLTEFAYVQPIREQTERSVRLQKWVTESDERRRVERRKGPADESLNFELFCD